MKEPPGFRNGSRAVQRATTEEESTRSSDANEVEKKIESLLGGY